MLKIGCWNVRTLQDNGSNLERRTAIIALELSRYDLDVVALSETRFADEGHLKELSGGYTFFWKGKDLSDSRTNGVGFALKNHIAAKLESLPKGINDRLMVLRLPIGKAQYATFVSAYAPTMTNPDDIKDKFYCDLESVLCSVPASDKLFLMGDFNARVGSDSSAWAGVIGKHGVGSCNSNGLRLLQKCAEHGLFITNTNFLLPVRNRSSWMHPRSKHWHLIDYIIVKRRDISDIRVTRAMCGAECGTDHRLIVSKVTMTLYQRRRPQGKAHPKRLDINKLSKSAVVQKALEADLNVKLNKISFSADDIESNWALFRDTIYETASETIGFPSHRHQDWFDENNKEIQDLIQKKRKLMQSTAGDPNSQSKQDALRSCKGHLQKKLRQMKDDWFEDRVRETQKWADTNNTHKFYESLRCIYGPSRLGTSPLLDQDGSKRITDKGAILKRWAEHFESVLNRPSSINSESIESLPQIPVNTSLDGPPTSSETKSAISVLSFNKAPGADSIPAEVFAFGGDHLVEILTKLFCQMWECGTIPQEFRDATIIHLYKNKGDRQSCDNHRGISLLSIAGKILARILLNRLLKHLSCNDALPESQCGFRTERGTADMIFAARQIQEKCIEQNQALYMTFVDLTKAFDTVSREGLWKILAKFGCPPKFITMVRQFHDGMKASVKSNGDMSNPFCVTNGVKQGCVLAPTLFSIMFSAMMHEAFQSYPAGVDIRYRLDGKLFNSRRLQAKTKTSLMHVCELLFADDCALLAHDESSMQDCVDRFSNACENFGLTISTAKTEVLFQPVPGDTQAFPPEIKIQDTTLKNVDSFKYLGSTLSSNARIDAEVALRMNKASASFGRLRERVWDCCGIRTETKLKVYKAVVLPTLLYGAETWTVYQSHAKKLNHFHLRCLRRILGIKWQDKIPDTEVLQRANAESLFSKLKKTQLRWAGHVVRMPDFRIPKAVFYSELSSGKRKVGAPKKCYKDTLKMCLKDFNIQPLTWESLALDRPCWRAAITKGSKSYEASRIRNAEAKREARKLRSSSCGSGDFKCLTCGKLFSARIGLIGHSRSHKSS